ncbi:hypothetical protein JL2886_01038 [Phaeobacter gallaeciensis]|uniref:Uncharacterized protein n=1 Tax=Phaeobacter gallaeciensis TaxID=60890 RepID=A0A1B0ZP66_9RHOB|nr:hypothetical protein JL2886_01038 [Phaeobacter gallaeciensis]
MLLCRPLGDRVFMQEDAGYHLQNQTMTGNPASSASPL